jgi:hypothetical protein
MSDALNTLLAESPRRWIEVLPEYQRRSIDQLLDHKITYDEVAQRWLTATAANTFRFGSVAPTGDRNAFFNSAKKEIRGYICGDKKYAKEREGLFGEKAPARLFIINAISVSIAPHLGVAVAYLFPIVALVLASLGSITINAYCSGPEAEK